MTEGGRLLTGGVLVVFLLDWLAVRYSWRKLECILKPLAMTMVILWTLTIAGWAFEPLLILLVFAQASGLAGDVFLLLSARWFLLGLGAFLVGHLGYISIMVVQIVSAFREFGVMNGALWWLALIILVWVLILVLFYRFVAPKTPRLTMPLFLWTAIQVYGWILSGMVVLSILTVVTMPEFTVPVVFLPVGATFFFISDSLLAYDRFKRKMPKIRVWIMVTYHLAQLFLAAGFLAALGFIG